MIPCILIVDDEAAVRRLVRELLEAEGYEVLDAADPEEAERLSREHKVDLVIADVCMPPFSGLDMGEHLASRQPGLVVMYMSGYRKDAMSQEAARKGREAFLAKPFTGADLLLRVRAAVGLPPSRERPPS